MRDAVCLTYGRAWKLARGLPLLVLLPGLADVGQQATELHFGWFDAGTMPPEGKMLQAATMAFKGVLLLTTAVVGWRWLQLNSYSRQTLSVVPGKRGKTPG